MTRDDDFIGQLEGYLEEHEGMTPLPAGVRDAIRAQLPMTKQLGRFSGPMRRIRFMNNNMVRVGLAAAVIALVIIVGIQFLPGPRVGTDASPTPEPTPTATPKAPFGQLEPGTYVVSDVAPPVRTLVPFTFTVPAGWVTRPQDLLTSKGDVSFVPWVVTHVYTDACDSEGNLTEVGPTVDDLVGALVDQANSDATAPVDVEIDGHPAKFITMSIPTDLDTATCRNPGLLIQIWANAAETDYFAIPVDLPGAVMGGAYIVDVNGERVVIVTAYTSAAATADVAELEGIIASVHFEP